MTRRVNRTRTARWRPGFRPAHRAAPAMAAGGDKTSSSEKDGGAVASNDSFGGRTKAFTDPRRRAAVVDRLTFNGAIMESRTDSCRRATARARTGHAETAG
ncbi:hypothetical protein [Streptomyces sp. NPDC085529]|uniref:hypothetical protein n=1 Tax=Streptomyces sp. NPDC085529 TaxID=3365729 RepID=UPI0037D90535